MKLLILISFCILSLQPLAQKQSANQKISGKITHESFIGTWKLTKLADKHLNYLKAAVGKEIIRFTKDSVFVTTKTKRYAGTWKLIDGQAVVSIAETNQFNYTWISGTENSKFFTTPGLGYYKYFVRTSKL